MRFVIRIGPIIGVVGLLAGCGSSQPGRTEGAMATGAATGGAIGLIGGPIGVVIGAAIGGGAGALTAVNTTPQQVNLPSPPWHGSSENGSGAGPPLTPDYALPPAGPPGAAPSAAAPLAAAPVTPAPVTPAPVTGVQSNPIPLEAPAAGGAAAAVSSPTVSSSGAPSQ
ncbi:MAG: hypothetical protein ACREFJ_04425 [Acetobacteraceae bacterium]